MEIFWVKELMLYPMATSSKNNQFGNYEKYNYNGNNQLTGVEPIWGRYTITYRKDGLINEIAAKDTDGQKAFKMKAEFTIE